DGGPLEAEDLAESLSEREATVLKAVASGLSNQAISKRLWVSEHTVKFHLTHIFRKLDVSNRTAAARGRHSAGIGEDGGDEGAETDDAGARGKASGKVAPRGTTAPAVA